MIILVRGSGPVRPLVTCGTPSWLLARVNDARESNSPVLHRRLHRPSTVNVASEVLSLDSGRSSSAVRRSQSEGADGSVESGWNWRIHLYD